MLSIVRVSNDDDCDLKLSVLLGINHYYKLKTRGTLDTWNFSGQLPMTRVANSP